MYMDKLISKFNEIQELAKSVMASLKQPKPPIAPQAPQNPQDTGPMKANTPKSNKDPKKIAEQISNPELKNEAMDQAKKLKEGIREKVTFNPNGQWKL